MGVTLRFAWGEVIGLKAFLHQNKIKDLIVADEVILSHVFALFSSKQTLISFFTFYPYLKFY